MKLFTRTLLLSALLIFSAQPVTAGSFYALCEGNFGQANASLWSFNEDISAVEGPLFWNTGTNPLGDVGQSLALYEHKLYIVMNNSHQIRILDLENGGTHTGDIDLPGASPRFMAFQHSQARGFVSAWNLGGLLIIDLNTDTVTDTLLLGGLPEELIIDGDRLFVSMTMHQDWSANNQVLELDISAVSPEVITSYEVIQGPGSMALADNILYVTSIYYNDAWESFSGTSRIDLDDGTVLSVDHGYYTNYSADIDIFQGTPYRTYGNFIVPLDDDLSFIPTGSIGSIDNIYSFSVQNDQFIVSSSDFVAPDEIRVVQADGSTQGVLTVGALPGDVIYYDPDVVALETPVFNPSTTTLVQNYPNPFNPGTTIRFHIQNSETLKLIIYDIEGRAITTLFDGIMSRGEQSLSWDGKNRRGLAMPSGIYWAVLFTHENRSSIRMTLLR